MPTAIWGIGVGVIGKLFVNVFRYKPAMHRTLHTSCEILVASLNLTNFNLLEPWGFVTAPIIFGYIGYKCTQFSEYLETKVPLYSEGHLGGRSDAQPVIPPQWIVSPTGEVERSKSSDLPGLLRGDK